MKKLKKTLIVVLIIVATLVTVVLSVMKLSGNHRSDPADVISYETDHPFITGRTELIAHRFGAGIAPEESRLAIDNCLTREDISMDILEFDIRMTKDGYAVVFHDAMLDETTDAVALWGGENILVADKTLDELRQLNMGALFTDADGNQPYADLTEVPDSLRIMTISEALDYLVANGATRFSIEAKDKGELGMRAADILYAELSARGLLTSTVFSTFKTDVGAYVAENYPDMIRSNTDAQAIEFYLAAITNDKNYVPPCTVFQLPFTDKYLNMGVNFGTAQVINYAHSHNIAVHYWVVDDPERMEYLESIGADGIMTDYPDILTGTIGAK